MSKYKAATSLPTAKARVVEAAGHEGRGRAVLREPNGSCVRVSTDQIIQLPAAAGGGDGVVDSIEMVVDESSGRVEFAIRVVGRDRRGHVFMFQEEES